MVNKLKFFLYYYFYFYEGEAFSKVKSIKFSELRNQVKIVQNCLKSYGIQKNDVVVGNYQFKKLNIIK